MRDGVERLAVREVWCWGGVAYCFVLRLEEVGAAAAGCFFSPLQDHTYLLTPTTTEKLSGKPGGRGGGGFDVPLSNESGGASQRNGNDPKMDEGEDLVEVTVKGVDLQREL